MFGPTLLRASRSPRLRGAVEANAVGRRIVTRFVSGEDSESAIQAANRLHRLGRSTSLDFLGEDVSDLAGARHVRDQYVALLFQLQEAGEAKRSEVSVKLSAVGQQLPRDGHRIAHDHAREICVAADAVGCLVTLDMEDHTTIDSTLSIGHDLRQEFPLTGSVLQANLRRTDHDLAGLTASGARIRLVKGAYREPRQVAFQRKSEVDDAYRRAIQVLMSSTCYPMIATHDPVMIEEAVRVAQLLSRSTRSWEVQMLYGIRDSLQSGTHAAGHQLRVYVPFGTDWYGYFIRRLAERPANVAFFLRALVRS